MRTEGSFTKDGKKRPLRGAGIWVETLMKWGRQTGWGSHGWEKSEGEPQVPNTLIQKQHCRDIFILYTQVLMLENKSLFF